MNVNVAPGGILFTNSLKSSSGNPNQHNNDFLKQLIHINAIQELIPEDHSQTWNPNMLKERSLVTCEQIHVSGHNCFLGSCLINYTSLGWDLQVQIDSILKIVRSGILGCKKLLGFETKEKKAGLEILPDSFTCVPWPL